VRSLAFTFTLVVSAAAFADSLRSDKHFVKIEVQSVGGSSRQYNVQVYESEPRRHLAHLRVVTENGRAAESETTAGDVRYTASVAPYGDAYLFEFIAVSGEEVIDRLRGGFTQAREAKPVEAVRAPREPAVLRRVEPVYTEEARAANATGTVVLDVHIDRSGFVREVTVLTPAAYGLSEAAVDAVKQWRFESTMGERGPIEVLQEVTIAFTGQ
jgi:TonB family protein